MIFFRIQNQVIFYLFMYLTVLARNPRQCRLEHVKLSILIFSLKEEAFNLSL